ncbi:hypothetical protein RRG08_020167 [Elysia crispata]|uniref:Uncharacterized protein n=1 Tax=Elysia crispata TaxID=231223 RepID=A0AAE0YZA6_9GAST|nr:hypothetical protein RRG08_020167 [Elysia crispata]
MVSTEQQKDKLNRTDIAIKVLDEEEISTIEQCYANTRTVTQAEYADALGLPWRQGQLFLSEQDENICQILRITREAVYRDCAKSEVKIRGTRLRKPGKV